MEKYVVQGWIRPEPGWYYRRKTFMAKNKDDAKAKAKKHWKRQPMFQDARVKIVGVVKETE